MKAKEILAVAFAMIFIPCCLKASAEQAQTISDNRLTVFYESRLFVDNSVEDVEEFDKYKVISTKNVEKYTTYQPTPDDLEAERYYDSLELLALCVEAEAGNQGLEGKRLVADVVLNRVDSDMFPNTIEGVITQKYHFTSYWNGAIERVEPSAETFEAIKMELETRSYPSVYYFTAGRYSEYGTPWKKIGDHFFSTM